ncbi:MarR family winged helix-turn-helix transcriptional regulator [Paralimibaculum aggregatum]|uniref:MarR family winged helix-turn-helix transcriptional regulator n=1 Tax=Paralimibaculum aggregatum TaxID=3036245 RepID=A0ABQ6LNH3_9RHOB|nr:MarR family transcriptional regulator [Limibaculum sp. NKW23]GMG81981.1 MarR family winged helix-turn-helix transcriptional regulator [Limibaculum sp. NKW23]
MRLDDQLCFALYAATNAVTRAYRPLLRDIGLTYPQYLVMLVLWQDGVSPIRHIADRLSLPPNALSPLVDRLEAQGLVRRERDKGDRRRIFVSLTQTGAELEAAAYRAQQQVACQTQLPHETYVELREELVSLVNQMSDAGDLDAIETPRLATVSCATA